MMLHSTQRFKDAKRVTLVGAAVNIILALLKLIFGFVGHSHALIADGVHSFSDLFTDILVLAGAKVGNQEPDEKHPYGHGRIETIVTIVVAITLLIVGIGIIIDAGLDIWHQQFVQPTFITLIVAFVSVVSNEGIFQYTIRVGRQIDSALLKANAWHHRSDAFSSLIVLFGIGGDMFGFHYLDATAAIIVAILLIYMAIKMSWTCIRELIDTGVDDETLQHIKRKINEISGIQSLHQLRTRLVGGGIFVDMHVQVDPTLSVSEGHYIGEQIPKNLIKAVPKIVDVMVHIDSEDDELATINLPNRQMIEEQLHQYWQVLPGYQEIQKINLHYVNDKIKIEFFLPLKVLKEVKDGQYLAKQYREVIKIVSFIADVKLFFSCD